MIAHERLVLAAAGLTASLLFSCKSESEASKSPTSAGLDGGESASSSRVQTFGTPLSTSPSYSLSDVLADPQRLAGQTIRVSGHVRKACSAKGCWMELATDSTPSAAACRVTFKDYGFFVPTDSAGAEAQVEGQVAVKRVRAAHVKHYEGEGATFPSKREDGSADEVRIVATGVELTR